MLKRFNRVPILQSVFRTSSIWYSFFKQLLDWDKYNQVVSGLFLGVIPTSTTFLGDYLNTSTDKIIGAVQRANPTLPLGLVVSITAADELAGEGFYGVTMVTPSEWENSQIEHIHVEMEDYTAEVNMETALQTIAKMRQTIENGQSVYLHCKAGRSRSAMFCAIYISLFLVNPDTQKKYTVTEATQLIEHARAQIDIEKDKVKLASTIIMEAIARGITLTDVVEEKKEDPEKAVSFSNRLNLLLLQKSTKKDVLELSATMALIEYGHKQFRQHPNKPSRQELLVDELLALIDKPHSEQWFYCMFNDTDSPFKEIADSCDTSTDLCETFRTEIMDYVASSLQCTHEQVLEVACCDRLTWEMLSPRMFRINS